MEHLFLHGSFVAAPCTDMTVHVPSKHALALK
jgi:hypothetical protein